MSAYVLWFGLLAPGNEEALERAIIVLGGWGFPTSQSKGLSNVDSKVVAALQRTPFASDEDDTRVAILGSALRAVEVKPKGSTVSFAAVGEDELELEEFLRAFAGNVAKAFDVDSVVSLSKASVASGLNKVRTVAEEMVSQGRVDHMGNNHHQQKKVAKPSSSTTPAGKS